MDFKKILEHFADAETAVTKQNAQLNEAAFTKSGVKADAKKNKSDATTRKQYFVKLAKADGGSKGVTVMADEGESESEVRSRVARDHKSQGWTVSSIREKGDAAEKTEAGEKKSSVTASGKKRGRPPGSTKKVTEGRQTVSEYIAEARLMEKSMSPAEKGERERIVTGMKKSKDSFEKRYPGRGEAVMYATATKRAMKEARQSVAEGLFGIDDKTKAKIQAIVSRISDEPGNWDHKNQKFTPQGMEELKGALKNNPKFIKYALTLNSSDHEAGHYHFSKDEIGEQSVAEGAKQFSPEMHDRIKNATPQQLSQMATNFAGSDYDRYDHELELLKKAQKELQGVAEGAPTYNRNYGHVTQPEGGVQAKTREAAMELLNGKEPKSFEIDVKFPVREPGGLYKTSANGRFSAAIKPAGYGFGGLPGKSNEYGRVYSPKFNSGGSARASFSKVMDLIKQLGGILAGDRIVVYTDKYVGVTNNPWYVGHDPVDASLEKILPNSLQGVAEGAPTYDRKHSYFNQPEDGVQVKTHEAARDLFDVPGTKSFEIDVFFPAEPGRTHRGSAAGKFYDAIVPTVGWGSQRIRKPNSYQVGTAPGMSDEQYRVYSPTFSSPGVALASFNKVMDLIKRFGGTLTGDHIVVYTDKIKGRNLGGQVDTNLENLPKSSQSMSEGAKCNHTEEGSECPVHGLKECGTYMEESQFDEDLNQMKKIAGVGAVAAAGLGAHISGENAEIRAKEVEKLEKQVAGEPNSVRRGQLEKMITDIKAGKPLSRGDIISEVNPHHYDSDVDYYDAVEAEEARLRGDYDDAEEAHYADQADQKAYDDDDMYEDSSDEAEYSDEVGMVENNLETIERAAEELESILQQGEDLPEWVEEKVSNAKAMLVSAKEYMASQHANGDVHHVDDEEMEESNEFIGALAKARAAHKDSFEVDGRTYPVKESRSAIDELAECYDMAYQQAQAEPEQPGRMTVSANTSTEGTRSLTVNAEGDMADELAQLLSLSGLAGGHGHQEEMDESSADEFHANTRPEPATFSLHRLLDAGDDLNAPKSQHPAAAARGDNPLTR